MQMNRLYQGLALAATVCAFGCSKDAGTEIGRDSSFVIRLHVEKGEEPQSIDEAVDMLIRAMSDDFRRRFARSDREFTEYEDRVGRLIRSEYGLWRGNSNLLASTGAHHPEDASFLIVHRAWERLRERR